LRAINDPRDLPFVWLSVWATLIVIPFAVALYVPGVFTWWLGLIYLAVNGLVFLDRYILMLHNTSHRPLFKPKLRWLNRYVPWVLGPFFGETPETYFAHHLGMHHVEDNLPGDLSSTMRFRRDAPLHFARYWARFFFLILHDLPSYLARTGRRKLARRAFFGELIFLVGVTGLMFVDWRATLVVFVIPFTVVRFLMMAGNWGQHAFVDPERADNNYVNSITCINTRYNRRCFNDGYHIGHHIKANRHWTEMPGDFERNVSTYASEGAIVFEGIDFFQVWLYLMLGRYDWLARRYVRLDGREHSEAEVVELLRSRTRPIQAWVRNT
jgi:hypothetical protein